MMLFTDQLAALPINLKPMASMPPPMVQTALRICGEQPCGYKSYPSKPNSSLPALASVDQNSNLLSDCEPCPNPSLRERKFRKTIEPSCYISYVLSPRQSIRKNRPGCPRCINFLFPSTRHTAGTLVSSQSSPESATVSSIFSPIGSVSSETSISSQNSFTDPHNCSDLVRIQPRIQVSSLLADLSARTYHLEVIQQPQRTAEFGSTPLSRLPLTPPIIARLTVRDSSGNAVVPCVKRFSTTIYYQFTSGDGSTALDVGSPIGPGHPPPILYGNLVSSIDQLEDLQGNMGLFFVFPDVSIRYRGQFQLGIIAMKISRSDTFGAMSIAEEGTLVAEARTQSFDVLPYHEYTAIPRTRLTNSFVRQGARMFSFLTINP